MKRKQLTFKAGFRVSLRNKRAQVAEMTLAPKGSEGDADNYHQGADQWLFVVDGTGVATVNRRKVSLRPGALLLIEHGDVHEIHNTGKRPLRTLNFYVPPAYALDGHELPPAKKK
jgi:mannose-6-phosphate isomerase-like protein (cupin superfamily)